MITIGIELNDVVRNVNAQMLKYYQRDFNPMLDIDDIDTIHEDVLSKYIKFGTKKELTNFLYIDYPYEIFGCARNCDKKFAQNFTVWLSDIPNHEGEEVRVVLYSLNEGELSIMSTFFYLSKNGTRVRKVIFPKSIDELWEECDVLVTANVDVLKKEVHEGKHIIGINRRFNKDYIGVCDFTYDSITDLMNDADFLEKVRKF